MMLEDIVINVGIVENGKAVVFLCEDGTAMDDIGSAILDGVRDFYSPDGTPSKPFEEKLGVSIERISFRSGRKRGVSRHYYVSIRYKSKQGEEIEANDLLKIQLKRPAIRPGDQFYTVTIEPSSSSFPGLKPLSAAEELLGFCNYLSRRFNIEVVMVENYPLTIGHTPR